VLFTSYNRAVIKLVREEKGWGAKKNFARVFEQAAVRMVYRDSVTSLNDLKEKIRHCWGKLN